MQTLIDKFGAVVRIILEHWRCPEIYDPEDKSLGKFVQAEKVYEKNYTQNSRKNKLRIPNYSQRNN